MGVGKTDIRDSSPSSALDLRRSSMGIRTKRVLAKPQRKSTHRLSSQSLPSPQSPSSSSSSSSLSSSSLSPLPTSSSSSSSSLSFSYSSPDLLSCLPPDVMVHIVEQLSDSDVRSLPRVCKRWAAMFDGAPSTEPLFRAIVRHRFGVRTRPPCAAGQSWGRLYLALRRERCHLCPNPQIAPFLYAASGALSSALSRPSLPYQGAHSCARERGQGQGQTGMSHLVLFPVCRRCFDALLAAVRDTFIPVIEHSSLPIVFPAVPDAVRSRARVSLGYLYSDMSVVSTFDKFQSPKPISYVLARPIFAKLASISNPSASSSISSLVTNDTPETHAPI